MQATANLGIIRVHLRPSLAVTHNSCSSNHKQLSPEQNWAQRIEFWNLRKKVKKCAFHSSAAAGAAVNWKQQATRQHFTAANNVTLKIMTAGEAKRFVCREENGDCGFEKGCCGRGCLSCPCCRARAASASGRPASSPVSLAWLRRPLSAS